MLHSIEKIACGDLNCVKFSFPFQRESLEILHKRRIIQRMKKSMNSLLLFNIFTKLKCASTNDFISKITQHAGFYLNRICSKMI